MFNDLGQALIITRREVRDQFRDWRIIGPIFVLTLFFPGLMNFTARQVVNYVEQFDAALIGDRLIPFLLMVVGFFPISITLVIALESFVGEKERLSIEPLLSSPLTDFQLYLGKLLAVVVPPLGASFMGIIVYLIGVYRQVGWTPEPILLIQVILLTTVQAILMVSGAVVISVQATTTRAANLLASFIIVPMALLLVGESMVMFWANYGVLWWAIFGQLIIAGLLIRTGTAYFNREDLLGREFDTLGFRRSLRVFIDAFKGEASSFPAWYRGIIHQLLSQMGLPILLVFMVIVIGGFIGSGQASVFVLPPEVIDFTNLGEGFVLDFKEFEPIRFFSVRGVKSVWLHNLRAITIATFLGVFTFGVFGLLTLMLPFVLIGYIMATAASTGISPAIFFSAFILPHGILEIPAILIAGAAILRIGATLTTPAKGVTMGEALVRSIADWTRMMVGLVIPLFLASAILEIYLTPRVVDLLFGL
jgi:uncharacterized membrane protein SpoIIM required for sporulation/ABC-type transport system involved in multi-copper enzyme maturation permease subunit